MPRTTGNLHGAVTWIALVLAGAAGAATIDPAATQRLIEEGRLDEALAAVDAGLAENRDDLNFRFMKGLVLTRMNRLDDAARVFRDLTEQHPELPEPYNNLAVVYAAQGDFERARQALQRAINTHPSYATAHENMGDIYAKMASQAYNQALELNQDNATAKAKLSLIGNLFSTSIAASPAAAVPPAPLTVAAAPAQPPPQSQPESRPEPQPEPQPAPVVWAEPKPAPASSPEPAPQVAPPAVPAAPEAIRRTIDLWATAWSARDVAAYLAQYAADFTPAGGESRAAWERTRRQRLREPAFIKVEVVGLAIEMLGADHARAQFTQNYQSDTFSDSVAKQLLLKRSGDGWQITQESVL